VEAFVPDKATAGAGGRVSPVVNHHFCPPKTCLFGTHIATPSEVEPGTNRIRRQLYLKHDDVLPPLEQLEELHADFISVVGNTNTATDAIDRIHDSTATPAQEDGATIQDEEDSATSDDDGIEKDVAVVGTVAVPVHKPTPQEVKSKKNKPLSLHKLAQVLDQQVYEREWFVTGYVNPTYFHPNFTYSDADVTLDSLQAYANNVYQLFDQSCSRAEIVETKVTNTNKKMTTRTAQEGTSDTLPTITCVWRCSGQVNLLVGRLPAGIDVRLPLKPFYVTTHWEIQDGLIFRQTDEYDLPVWDVVLSAIFPFLNGVVTAPPAPPVPPRRHIVTPKSPLEAWMARSGLSSYFDASPITSGVDLFRPLEDLVHFLTEETSIHTKTMQKTPTKEANKQQHLSLNKSKKMIVSKPSTDSEEPLPTAIRSPTVWDRLQAFKPDLNPILSENLSAASRRTDQRRARRYYVTYHQAGTTTTTTHQEEEKDDGSVEHIMAFSKEKSGSTTTTPKEPVLMP
jgi:hypothetical protein